LAVTVGAIVHMLLLFISLRRMLGRIDGKRIIFTLIKSCAAAFAMGITVFYWAAQIEPLVGTGKLGSVVVLSSSALIGMVIFTIITKLMRMEEFNMAMDMLGRKTHN